MKKYIPTKYYQSVYDVPYQKLKEDGIKCILFDLDNTICLIDEEKCNEKIVSLIEQLKKDFYVAIISNNTKKRVSPYKDILNIDVYYFAMKPFSFKYKKIKKDKNFNDLEIAVIGDQIMTDIVAGNKIKAITILVDPLGIKDLKVTSINRFFENIIFKKFKEKGILERGKYNE